MLYYLDAKNLQLQVLTTLEPLDYIVVAFLPGLTEVSVTNLLNIVLYTFVICSTKKLRLLSYGKRKRPEVEEGNLLNSYLICVLRAGTSFPWCNFAAFWAKLAECLPSCRFIWGIAPGQWSKIFLCCLVLVTFSVESFTFSTI